ncbi:MAG TPA: hypothetical protein VG738_17360 [Chitinophagaceae bacterium]|nr:hypothetical protein [Chitinophagaceae bacterium]
MENFSRIFIKTFAIFLLLLTLLLACRNSTRVNSKILSNFDSTLGNKEVVIHIDTFIESKDNYFRIIHFDSLYQVVLEQLIDSSWKRILKFDLNFPESYNYKDDVDGDGFRDIIVHRKWSSDVYFFNPKNKSFLTTALEDYPNSWFLINNKANIYCGMDIGMGEQGSSELYTFEDHKPYYLYKIVFNPYKNDLETLGDIIFYKCLNGNANDTVKVIGRAVPILKSIDEFDYKEFWLSKYRAFLEDDKFDLNKLIK